LGMDLVCRMGLATKNDTGWHWTTNYGYWVRRSRRERSCS
jgi:hypothetical protein